MPLRAGQGTRGILGELEASQKEAAEWQEKEGRNHSENPLPSQREKACSVMRLEEYNRGIPQGEKKKVYKY